MGLASERATFIIDGKGTVRASEHSAISMIAHSKLIERWDEILEKERSGDQPAQGLEHTVAA